MAASEHDAEVVVVGAGPAGVVAALRAAEMGADTTLVTDAHLGGMAADDGPIPVRTLAHAARLVREARQLGRYGIAIGEPALDYPALLRRVREVAQEVRTQSVLRADLVQAGVNIVERAGPLRFVDANTVQSPGGARFRGERLILCVGGKSRRLDVPGSHLTATHSDAWGLDAVPPSMLVVGAGATGVQVASIFSAFGSRVALFEAGPRILASEDEDIASVVGAAFKARGMDVREGFGSISRFEEVPGGVRMTTVRDGIERSDEAAVVIVAVGWSADPEALNLEVPGVRTDERNRISVDDHLQTSVPHIFAAGDVTGRSGLASQAANAGYVAASNAVAGPTMTVDDRVTPVGSFTDPEYAHVGLGEESARASHDIVVSRVGYGSVERPIIDGRTEGLCKLIVGRETQAILGCHVVGERAVEIAGTAATAMAAGMHIHEFARLRLSFPTYTNVLSRAAVHALPPLGISGPWEPD